MNLQTMLSELASKPSSQLGNLNGFGSGNSLGDNSRTSKPLGNGADPRISRGIWSNSVASSNQSSKPQSPFPFPAANQDDLDGNSKPNQPTDQKQSNYESRWSSWSTKDVNTSESQPQSNGLSLLQVNPTRPHYDNQSSSRHIGSELAGQYSSQQNGISQSASSLTPGYYRHVDKSTNGKHPFVSMANGLKLWDESSSPLSREPQTSFQGKSQLHFSTAGAARNGTLPLRYGNESSSEDPFARFSSRPSPGTETPPIRPTTRHSDQDLNVGISRLSIDLDNDGPDSRLPSRRPSGFGINTVSTPGHSMFPPSDLHALEDNTIGTNGFNHQSSGIDAPSITRREKTFGLVFNNPQVAPFRPNQSTPPHTQVPSRTGSWQADAQAMMYEKAQNQLQPMTSSLYEPVSTIQQPLLMDQTLPQQRFGNYQQTQIQLQQMQQMNTLQQMQFNSWQMQYPMNPFSNIFMNGLMPQVTVPQIPSFPLPKPDNATTASPTLSRPTTQDWMSQKIKDFRSTCKSRKWEIQELSGHIVELSGDQQGSRYLQSFLATASTQDKTKIFDEIFPNAVPLMQDVFGNYVIQKFFEYGDQMQKKLLGGLMTGHVCNMSLNTYGCRVVQKAFEHVLADQQAALVSELNKPGMVLRCIEDQHGNHVIQKAIEVVPTNVIRFVYDELMGRILSLSEHNFGCRVVQRMLEQKNPTIRQMVLVELRPGGERLITSTYGNYVAQHIISHGDQTHREWMKGLVFGNIRGYGQDKFASNVVEICIKEGSDEERRFIRDKIIEEEEGKPPAETGMVQFLKCNYGNYVVQKFIEYFTGEDRRLFIIQLEHIIDIHRRLIPKRVLDEIEHKLNRPNSRRPSKTKDGIRLHSRHVSRTSTSSLANTNLESRPIMGESLEVKSPDSLTADSGLEKVMKSPSIHE